MQQNLPASPRVGIQNSMGRTPRSSMLKEAVPGFFDSAPIRKMINSPHEALRSK